jgi:hypothetical protein
MSRVSGREQSLTCVLTLQDVSPTPQSSLVFCRRRPAVPRIQSGLCWCVQVSDSIL